MKYAVRFLAVLASLSFVSVSIHAQAHDGHLPQPRW
jgi:hypothetical protein